MYNISKPTHDFQNLLEQCVNDCRISREEMLDFIPEIVAQAVSYDSKASAAELYSIIQMTNIPFDKKRLVDLYRNHFTNKDKPIRNIYNELILSAKNRKCPFCSEGIVSELDHYLPKKIEDGFPEFSILPLNLVPCCSDCNSRKGEKIPEAANMQFIHPYYDQVSNERWLYAKVKRNPSQEIDFVFYANPPADWEELLKERLKYHFDVLALNEIYGIKSAEYYSDIGSKIEKDAEEKGFQFVLDNLLEFAESCEYNNKNSWRTAMYYALLEDSFWEENY